MRIGELADEVGLTTKTIRYYESIGLVPEPGRTQSGYRDYGVDVVERLRFVKQAQASGLTLAEIRSILEIKDAGGQSCAHTRELLLRHLDAIDAQIEAMRRQRHELAELADRAAGLDPETCTDAQRCQVIVGGGSGGGSGAGSGGVTETP
ncbi:MAG: heavy metal-responsive transcriptional regulator [Acidimicrobiales bacterium]